MQTIKGIAVSPGVVIGKFFVLDEERQRIPRRTVPPERVETEVARLEGALRASVNELAAIRAQAQREMGEEAAKIFLVHIGLLNDRALTEPMRQQIRRERVTAEYAAHHTLAQWAERFGQMEDPAFTTKVNDLNDLSARVLKHLIGEHRSRLAELDHQAVVAARDLTPSQAAAFDREKVIAFATDLGGRTSHTSIVARALGIPAVVGCQNVTQLATDGTPVIVDGDRGVIVIDPDPATIAEYERHIEQRRLFQLSLGELRDLPSRTLDGQEVELLANIEFPQEIPLMLDCGGGGVGLYRTEFLYLVKQKEPTEEEQFEAYRACVEALRGRPLTIRTLDLGADKYTQTQAESPERNPFLGLRSIRYCLKRPAMFRRQLRAILRASALGPVKVMFPLVTTVGELRQAKWMLHEAMEDLEDEGVAFDRGVKVGMMIEVPSAAIMADAFAREVDFFSIGTNDLVQYTVAVDRTNERVSALYTPAHPAVIRLIRDVTRVARRRGIPISCCGEAAGEPEFALLLLGLGVRTLSMTAASIPRIKRVVRSVRCQQCEQIARKALSFDSEVEVASYLRDQTRKIIPEAFDTRSVEEQA